MILHQFIDYETLRLIWWLLIGDPPDRLCRHRWLRSGHRHAAAIRGENRYGTAHRRSTRSARSGKATRSGSLSAAGRYSRPGRRSMRSRSRAFISQCSAILAALIVRPVAFKYRSKRDSPAWRTAWDCALFIGGFVPALIFGVAIGNVLQGVPFRFNSDLRIFYEGTFFGLLNPFALLCGLLSLAMLVMHGSAWLMLKTSGTCCRAGTILWQPGGAD